MVALGIPVESGPGSVGRDGGRDLVGEGFGGFGD